jgi:hypothetical protein
MGILLSLCHRIHPIIVPPSWGLRHPEGLSVGLLSPSRTFPAFVSNLTHLRN